MKNSSIFEGELTAKWYCKCLTKKDKLTFGKYKGHTINWIVNNDPSYVLWLDENVLPIRQKIVEECEMLCTYYDEDGFFGDEWWKD